ncbi:hypothetical protein CR513_16559, partial [Mucuna pruriens]
MVEPGRVKIAEAEAVKGPHSTETLHQRRKLPFCPMRMAIGGFAATVVIGYFVLYSHKKPEASAMDVAKITGGMSNPENTRPRNYVASMSVDSSRQWPSHSRQKLSRYDLGGDLSDLVSANSISPSPVLFPHSSSQSISALGVLMAIAKGSSNVIPRIYTIATSSIGRDYVQS